MSPTQPINMVKDSRGPRASGDEPLNILAISEISLWSPRERG